jgi:hypothetical protein
MPIMQGLPVEVHKSERPLTLPKSPKFQTKERAASRRRSVSLA